MTGGWAATNTLRTNGFCEAMAQADGGIAEERQCWERRLARKNWCYPCSERGDALALVEAALDAAEPMANLPWPLSADERQEWIVAQNRMREALRAVREGK